jgi:2-polyprenyl-3-methyl-5-hydroxy-6-metoxy-1,4-benzoquinol methylase
MSERRLFWNLIAKRYIAGPVPDETVYQRKLAETRARLKPDWDLLEVGCGSGNTALAHAPYVAHVHAVDFARNMLAHGRARAESEQVANIDFECSSLAELATDKTYDAVLMLSLIHLIPDWQGAIAKAWALTRPGGIFVSSTACLGDTPALARLALKALGATGLLPRLAQFTPETLIAAIEAQGFAIEEAWKPGPKAAQFIIARRPD